MITLLPTLPAPIIMTSWGYYFILLMADHSKVATPAAVGFIQLVQRALLGSSNGRAFSGLILAIIAYLIYAKNKKTSTDSLRVGEKRTEKKVRIV